MSQQQQMNMAGMAGGPVGGGPAITQQMNMGTPGGGGGGGAGSGLDAVKMLNIAIYDYLLRNKLYDTARSFVNQPDIEMDVKKSPNQRQGGQQLNGNVDDGMEIDNKEIQQRPDDLPAPAQLSDGPFLQDWWCQFWEIWQGNRSKGKPTMLSYVGSQRQAQKARNNMMSNMDPAAMQNIRAGYNNMGMNNGMGMGNDLKRQAMQNPRNMTPAQQAQMRNMMQQNAQMQANQMERQGSQMGIDGPRSGSPGSGEAPSPKRQRLEGNMPQMNRGGQPGPPGQMQSSQGMPPNPAAMGPAGAQGSPMSQAGIDGANAEFYAAATNGGRMPQIPAAAAAAVAAGGPNSGNHALQDYQMQLMLLEQQNKKRLLMARQEQDSMAHPTGVGPNGQPFPQGMSPSGSRAGDPSPNPNDMARGTPNMKKAGMSPNGDMTGRGSPQPGMMDPNLRQMMQNGQMGMRPPSSHPHPMGVQMTPEQMAMMQSRGGQLQMANGAWPGGPQPGPQMMPGQQPGQPPMGQQVLPNATPKQPQQVMGPPAPPGPQSGTQPSSPAQPAAPPTPNQTNKAKPGKKGEQNKKVNKKGGNQPGATPASEAEGQPPTPTPATPMTPMHQNSFNHQQNKNIPNGQQPPNGPNPPQQQNQPQPGPGVVQPPAPDMSGPPFGNLDGADQFGSMNLEFAGLDGGDVLDNFDFDSFLNTGGDDGLSGFDANFAFGDSIEAGPDLTGN